MAARRHVSNHDVLKKRYRIRNEKKKKKKKKNNLGKMRYVPFPHAPTIVIICGIVSYSLPHMLMSIVMRPGQAYTSAQSNQDFSVRQYFLQYQTVEFEAKDLFRLRVCS